MSQLDIFELIDDVKINSVPSFEIGERVKVKKVVEEDLEKLGSEDYFYLKDFSNKKGIVVSVEKNNAGVFSYKIEFERDLFGYFYESDLIRLHRVKNG